MSGHVNKELEGIAVGGHGGAAIIPGPEPGRIQKKVNKQDEVRFYQSLPNHYNAEQISFFPAFYGTTTVVGQGNYFVMEDLTYHYQSPCMLDIKMGRSSVGEDADPSKKAAMEEKDRSTTTTDLGQRITGFRVYNVETDSYTKRGKDFTKKITAAQYLDTLRSFFHNGKRLRSDLIRHFLVELERVYQFMSTQRQFRFYSSSLLFVYDGKNPEYHGRLKLIDFAHAHPIRDNGLDESYLYGLERLIQYFRQLSHEH